MKHLNGTMKRSASWPAFYRYSTRQEKDLMTMYAEAVKHTQTCSIPRLIHKPLSFSRLPCETNAKRTVGIFLPIGKLISKVVA